MDKYDLIYFCDGYPDIGMGHVFRGIDITNAFVKKHPEYKVALQGRFQDQSKCLIRQQLNPKISILNSDDNSKVVCSIIDTMFYPGEQRINQEYFFKVRKKSSTLIFLWDAIDYTIPEEVDIVINHLPYCKINDNYTFEKYIGLDYSPVPLEYYNNSNYNLKMEIYCCYWWLKKTKRS